MAMDRSLQLQCLIVLSLGLVGLTTASPPYQICGAANFDVRNLTSKMWRFAVPPESCLRRRTANATGRGCDMTMAFCRSVNLSQQCSQAAVCESFGLPGNDSYNLAAYRPYSNPFDTAALESGVGFTTRYEHGETYTKGDNSTCILSMVMTFRCNLQASWDSDDKAGDVLTVPLTPHVQLTLGGSVCMYNVTFEFAGACPMVTPNQPWRYSHAACPDLLHTQSHLGLVLPQSPCRQSTGNYQCQSALRPPTKEDPALLLGLFRTQDSTYYAITDNTNSRVVKPDFLVTAAVYLLLGVFINVLRGQSGLALVPHHDFWITLPGYIKDGAHFTVSCGGQSSGRTSYESI